MNIYITELIYHVFRKSQLVVVRVEWFFNIVSYLMVYKPVNTYFESIYDHQYKEPYVRTWLMFESLFLLVPPKMKYNFSNFKI